MLESSSASDSSDKQPTNGTSHELKIIEGDRKDGREKSNESDKRLVITNKRERFE